MTTIIRSSFTAFARTRFAKLGFALTLAYGAVGTAYAGTGTDFDQDFVDDGLEGQLAARFFPIMNMSCGPFGDSAYGSQGQFYGTDVGYATNGRLPYTAHVYADGRMNPCNESGRCIEIRYGMAYNFDMGDDVFGGGHPGDSEVVSLLLFTDAAWDVANADPNVWRIGMIYRSAHACAEGDSSSFHDWNSTQIPENWVAEGKNSNYWSKEACSNGGVAWVDDCEGPGRCEINRDAAIARLKNAGEFGDPTIGDGAGHIPRQVIQHGFVGYSTADSIIPAPGGPNANSRPYGSYDVWGPLSFGEAGSYCRHLTRFLDWATKEWSCTAHPDCP